MSVKPMCVSSRVKKKNNYHKAIILFFAFLFAIGSLMAQGSPPPTNTDKGPVQTNGDPPYPPGAPLDSNAIYVLIAGGLLYLLFINRKRILIKIKSSN